MKLFSQNYRKIDIILKNISSKTCFGKRNVRNISSVDVREALNSKQIQRVLIANRGEIACRIIRSAKRLGIETVAVYSDADSNSMHTRMADHCYHIGSSQSSQSYLNQQKLIDCAIASNSCAIHPGYGFLSENAEFSEICSQNNIIFMGPKPKAIRDMGIKSTSKTIMSSAGVPVVPGYHGDNQSDHFLLEEANKIGFPVMIKAVRGGGGKGMRIAIESKDFMEQLGSARREANKAFGDDSVLIEKYVSNPRHIEVQVFGDSFGNFVYLFERDCSVQRRHQKIIEEAPAPRINESIRKELGTAAVKAAKAVDYLGAGTVEFIYDPKDSKFYFMEMNTRLQVEHPITEMITGTDLVEWQFRVASGQPLPLKQSELTLSGHSFEARIYAEDPNNNFMPGAGPLLRLETPEPSSDLRIETGVREGDEVSVHYDPMIAKLVVWGQDRESGLRKLRQSLSYYNVVGLQTNVDFLLRLSNHSEFKAGNVYTNFIEDYNKDLFPSTQTSPEMLCTAVITHLLNEKVKEINRNSNSSEPFSPFGICDNKRFGEIPVIRSFDLIDSNNKTHEIKVDFKSNEKFTLEVGSQTYENIAGEYDNKSNELTVEMRGVKHKYRVLIEDNNIYIFTKDGSHTFQLKTPDYLRAQTGESGMDSMSVTAPMPGIIDKILVTENQSVKTGDSLVVMIAMKMEYIIKAKNDGVVDKLLYKTGDNVSKGVQIISFK